MKNVLVLNLHQRYEGFAEGKLTKRIVHEAEAFFALKRFNIRTTTIETGYDVAEELDKFRWADAIFLQTPVYWMSVPWTGKKYIDEIFSGGYGTVTYKNDGRAGGGAYGSGGLMNDKRYMLSFTYNCPESEFGNPEGFFEGADLDGAHIALHKTFQFCGAKPMESFSVHDVYGDFDLEGNLARLREVLGRNFG